MFQSRRRLMISLSAAAGIFLAAPRWLWPQSPPPPLKSVPPPRSDSGDLSNSGDAAPLPKAAATKALLEENEKNMKKDVERLFDLANELKTQIEKTDSTTVLSLSLVKKAEEIEKLAKQIKERAKG